MAQPDSILLHVHYTEMANSSSMDTQESVIVDVSSEDSDLSLPSGTIITSSA